MKNKDRAVGGIFHVIKEMFSLPEVTINMWGECYEQYRYFTSPHPKYKLIQNKKWGVALLQLPDTYDEFMRGKARQALRTNSKNAVKNGFSFVRFSPAEHLDEILEINSSLNERQGRAMDSSYLSKDALLEFIHDEPEIYGVLNRHNELKAYTHILICGDVMIFSRLLGHGEDLDKGVMYLLIGEVMREMIAYRNLHGYPSWAMYDTFFGASPGLKYFKERLGFKPYKVKWAWLNETPNCFQPDVL